MTTREEQEAYYAGRDAADESKSEKINPYDREDDWHLWRWWEKGWKEFLTPIRE